MHNHQHYRSPFEFEPEETFYNRPDPIFRHLIIAAFYLSFAVSLAMFFLYWIMPTTVPAWLPTKLADTIELNQPFFLLLPLLCLFLCYWALRSMTSDILACPERYLDERQKMLRDQVHRSAYKILKVVCFIIPAVILLSAIPGTMFPSSPAQISSNLAHTTPSQTFGTNSGFFTGRIGFAPSITVIRNKNTYFEFVGSFGSTSPVTYIISDKAGHLWLIKSTDTSLPGISTLDEEGHLWFTEPTDSSLPTAYAISVNNTQQTYPRWIIIAPPPEQTPVAPTTPPLSWQHDPVRISLFFGSFLLNIFLLISALPMALLAWKEKE